MQKILAFFNRYKVVINILIVIFWLTLIYKTYQELQHENKLGEKKGFFVLASFFVLVSIFNVVRALKEKGSKS